MTDQLRTLPSQPAQASTIPQTRTLSPRAPACRRLHGRDDAESRLQIGAPSRNVCNTRVRRQPFQNSSKDLPAGIVILAENEICKRMERAVGGLFARQATMRFATSKAPIVNCFQSGASAALCDELNQTKTIFAGSRLRLHYTIRAERPDLK